MIKDKKNIIYSIFLKTWRPLVWLALVIFLVYFTALSNGLVYLDDNVLVAEHYQFNKDWKNILQAFNEDIFRSAGQRGTFYRPLLRLSFILDAQFGENIVIFCSHLSNLLLHIFSIFLFFYFLLKLGIRRDIAFGASLISGIHPLTAQTVAFIAGRNDSLLAIFVFLFFILLLNFLRNGKLKYFFSHLILFALALLTKETAVILPVISVVYLLIFIGFKRILKDYQMYLTLALGWCSIVFIWFLTRLFVLDDLVGNAEYDFLLSIYNNLPSLIPAIGKIFLPFDLSVFPILSDMSMVYGAVSLSILVFWFIFSKNKRIKFIIFGLAWFFLFIFLTLLKPAGTFSEFSENRIYLPMFGFIFVILGSGRLKFLSDWRSGNKKDEDNKSIKEKKNGISGSKAAGVDLAISRNNKNFFIGFLVIIILVFSIITIYRNKYYVDGYNFWKNAVKTSPSSAFNHNNLGAMYYLAGRLDEAEIEFKKALELNPKEPLAHNNLGLIYAEKNLFEQSEEEYFKELANNQGYINAYNNLGLLYYKQEKYNQAEEVWKTVLVIDPEFLPVIIQLVDLYYKQERYEEARPFAETLYKLGYWPAAAFNDILDE